MPIYSVSELLEELSNFTQEIREQFTQEGNILKGEVFLSGILDSPKRVISYLTDQELLMSFLYKKGTYSDEDENEEGKDITLGYNLIKSQIANVLELHDRRVDGKKLQVQPNQEARLIDVLNFKKVKDSRYDKGFFKLILPQIKRLLIEKIRSWVDKDFRGRGFRLGDRHLELGILPGTNVVMKAEVVYFKHNHYLTVRQPQIISSGKDRIIKLFHGKQQFKKFLRFLLLAVFVYSSIQALRCLIRILRTWYVSYKKQRKDPLFKLDTIELDDMRCILCVE